MSDRSRYAHLPTCGAHGFISRVNMIYLRRIGACSCPPPLLPVPSDPHSRACGWLADHDHGPACKPDCPTCAGVDPAASTNGVPSAP